MAPVALPLGTSLKSIRESIFFIEAFYIMVQCISHFILIRNGKYCLWCRQVTAHTRELSVLSGDFAAAQVPPGDRFADTEDSIILQQHHGAAVEAPPPPS